LYLFTPDLRERITTNLAVLQPRILDAAGLRHAAVGVVLLPDDQRRTCFVLTRRLSTLRRHSGQWALPGGRLEVGETAADAALREIEEEVGLRLPADAILGRLDDFSSRSGHLISPLVLWTDDDSALIASPDEVDAAFRIPIDELVRPGSVSFEPLLHFAFNISSVYAPTAAILYQFGEVGLHGRDVRVGHVEQPFFAWS
jgi:8-oxo-dGTP pyrophosphatase MutT (NUDIX family)